MQRYNLVYYPSDPAVSSALVTYAQQNFAAAAGDYLLDGQTALPHITLCQFHAPEPALPELWVGASAICAAHRKVSIRQLGFHTSGGQLWATFGLVPCATLLDDQAGIVDCINQQGLQPLTGTRDGYFPHLTLANLRGTALPALTQWPDVWNREHDFHLALGRSAANGVFQHILRSVETGS